MAMSLRRDVEAICFPKGRMIGSPEHEKARLYLASRLKALGCVPWRGDSYVLPYRRGGIQFFNVVGVLPGRNRSKKALLLGAHYDSVIPYPCADDNAAAVAISLAAGASLAGELEHDLILAFFDAEEPPHFLSERMGSIRFYEDQLEGREIHAALIMDLVGHDLSVTGQMLARFTGGLTHLVPGWRSKDFRIPLLHSLLFVTGAESHPELAGVIDEATPCRGLRVAPTINEYVGDMSDHGIFRQRGVPYFFLSCGLWAHYHTPTDTPDRLNYTKMAHISDYVKRLMEGLDRRALLRENQEEKTCETLDLESRHLRSAFGILYPLLLRIAGVRKVNQRKDMDAVAYVLRGLAG